MKSPDEIKKGLDRCSISYADCNNECPYKRDCDGSKILKDALALIQQLEAQVPRWISVKERLPEGEVIALCYDPDAYCYGEYIVGYVSPYSEPDGVGFRAENDYELLDCVTHWMPLPEPPKEEPHEENPHTI